MPSRTHAISCNQSNEVSDAVLRGMRTQLDKTRPITQSCLKLRTCANETTHATTPARNHSSRQPRNAHNCTFKHVRERIHATRATMHTITRTNASTYARNPARTYLVCRLHIHSTLSSVHERTSGDVPDLRHELVSETKKFKF